MRLSSDSGVANGFPPLKEKKGSSLDFEELKFVFGSGSWVVGYFVDFYDFTGLGFAHGVPNCVSV